MMCAFTIYGWVLMSSHFTAYLIFLCFQRIWLSYRNTSSLYDESPGEQITTACLLQFIIFPFRI